MKPEPDTAPGNATSRPDRLAFKITEAAQLLGLSTITVRRAIARGLIKPIRAFRTPLISSAELERFVNQSPTQNRF